MLTKPALVTLTGILCLLLIVPAVNAQTASVTILNAPSQVHIGSDGTATFDVTAQVSFSAIPEGVYSGSAAHWDSLTVILGYYSNGNMPNYLSGSTSGPDQCLSSSGTGCGITPNCQFTTTYPTCSGTDDIAFNVIISNAQPQQSHFEVYAEIILTEPSQMGLYNPVVSPQVSSDFYVNFVNAPTEQQYTAPTYAQYTPSTVQPTYQPEQTGFTAYGALLLWCFAIAAVIIFIIWFSPFHKRTKPVEQQVQQPEAKPSTSSSKVSDKQFCLECGTELPLGSKFCKECGTKQS